MWYAEKAYFCSCKREEEEYRYKLKKSRQKEQDEYETRKAQQVKDYADKAATADSNVKDIALKAIESSGKMQIVTKGGGEE